MTFLKNFKAFVIKEEKLLIIFFSLAFLSLFILAFIFFIDVRSLSPNSPLNPILTTTQKYLPLKKIERWQAKGAVRSNLPIPDSSARAVFLLDFEKEKIIYQKNSEEQLPVASLSKLMTAAVTLEMAETDELLSVSSEATSCGEAAVGLKDGESLTVKELLYGMLLVSGNDTSEVLARNIGKEGRRKFLDWMKQKAKNLGLNQTSFVNPTGLDEDDGRANLSSAGDLAAIFYYLYYNFPLFREIFTTKEFILEENIYHQQYDLFNTSWDFADDYPYLLGGKSGNTDQAGFCLLALAKKDKQRLLLIILGEPEWENIQEDVAKFFDYGFTVLEDKQNVDTQKY